MPKILSEYTYTREGNDCTLTDKVLVEIERDGKTYIKRFSSASGWAEDNAYYEREIKGESLLERKDIIFQALKDWGLLGKVNLGENYGLE